jgi:nitrogen fixation protein FixH
MSPAFKWIGAIVGLLLANVSASAVLVVASSHGASRVIPDYYERGVHYDDRLDEASRDRALGWHVDVIASDGALTVFVTDRDSSPLAHAAVHVITDERSTGNRRELTTVSTVPGAYRGTNTLHGWLDLSISVERDSQRYAAQTAVLAP